MLSTTPYYRTLLSIALVVSLTVAIPETACAQSGEDYEHAKGEVWRTVAPLLDGWKDDIKDIKDTVDDLSQNQDRLNQRTDHNEAEIEGALDKQNDNRYAIATQNAILKSVKLLGEENHEQLEKHDRDLESQGRLLGEAADRVEALEEDADKLARSTVELKEEDQRLKEELQAANSLLNTMSNETLNNSLTISHLNRFWVLICAALVFFMQAGFLCLETGLVREHHRHLIGVKNLIDWMVVTLLFWLVGFGIIFGWGEQGGGGTLLAGFR